MKPLLNFSRAVKEVRRFNALAKDKRSFVFYAEDAGSYVHFSEIIASLTRDHGKTVCYLTSSPEDPNLTAPAAGVLPFYIGEGITRTFVFQTLDADVMAMTMPDLETFHLKRSRYHEVKYAYVFHSMVSTHVIYREAAFDHFDALLCVGPHHHAEVKKREQLLSLPAKQLFNHGYGRLDSLRAQGHRGGAGLHVVVAPSWGPQGLLENHAGAVLDTLLAAGLRVTLRPHPRTWHTHRAPLEKAVAQHAANPLFALDTARQSDATFRSADVLISDWSGSAFEFAFAFEKPVLFVDVPQKVNNPNHERLALDPVEKKLRPELGIVLPAGDLTALAPAVKDLHAQAAEFEKRIKKARSETVYNLGSSGKAGAQALVDLAINPQKSRRTHAK